MKWGFLRDYHDVVGTTDFTKIKCTLVHTTVFDGTQTFSAENIIYESDFWFLVNKLNWINGYKVHFLNR